MSLEVPSRGPLTDALVAWMRASEVLAGATPPVLIGDGKVPNAAGWNSGRVGEGLFVSSVTVTTLEASPWATEVLTARHTSWVMPYRLKTISGSRTGADAIADVARAHARAFPRDGLDLGGNWQVLEGYFDRLAAVNPRGEVDQETWEADDTLYLRVTRGRGTTFVVQDVSV